MPELKNNFTGGKMDKDLDERLIPSGSYRDAWNVEVATSEESDLGALQNILGNKKINNSCIPAGAVCVGSIADDKSNKLYLFLAASQSKIIEWDPILETLVVVFADGSYSTQKLLAFDPTKIITGINIVDDLLFWTDNNSEPKKIHIQRSIEGTSQPDGNYLTRVINPSRNIDFNSAIFMKEEYITVIKKGPKIPPVLRLESRGSSSVRLYVGRIPHGNFNSQHNGIGGVLTLDAQDLIPGYYGNSVQQHYKPGDFLYLKAVKEIPNVYDSDFDDQWSNGSEGSYDVKVQVNSIGDTVGDENAMGGLLNMSFMYGTTPIEVTIIGPSLDGQLINGQSSSPIYTITNLNDPPIIFEKKFPRFATRWKYLDSEYSAMSPFSPIAFVPGTFNYHPRKGHNLGMINNLYAVHVEQFIPINIPYDVVAVDILYREAGSPNIYIIDTISKNDPNIIGKTFNYWDSYYEDAQLSPAYSGCNNSGNCFDPNNVNEPNETSRMKGTYKITSDNISKAIPEDQTVRHWDNVPRKALAQEVIGNRLVYANYLQGYNLYEGSNPDKPYKPRFDIGIESYNPVDTQETRGTYLPSKPSIKSLRTYQVGIVYQDKFGRQSPVLTSASGVLNTDKDVAITQHRITVKPLTDPPSWATDYKYFIKETSSEYYNLAMDRIYDAEDGNVWIAFPSSDRAKVDEEDYLILKKDANGAFVKEKARYKILAIENQVPEFVKTRMRDIGVINYDANYLFGSNPNPWVSTAFDQTEVPVENTKVFTTKIIPAAIQELALDWINNNQGGTIQNAPFTIDSAIDAKLDLRVVNDGVGEQNGDSDWFPIEKIIIDNMTTPTSMDVHLESPFNDTIRFSYKTSGGQVKITYDDSKLEFRSGKVEYKSWFDGRFFVKIERDNVVDSKVITASNGNLVSTARKQLYYIHSGEGNGIIWDDPSQTNNAKTPNAADDTIYAPSNYSIGSSGDKFNGGYSAYGDSWFSQIKNPIGCLGGANGSPNCDASVQPSITNDCADGTCLEGHIPPGGATMNLMGPGFASSTIGWTWHGSNPKRNRLLWKHLVGLYDYQGHILTSGGTPYNVPTQSNPGIWFIDRTYYSTNMSTNHNPGFTQIGDTKYSPATCPIGNVHRMRGIDCDQPSPPNTMDLSFQGVLDGVFVSNNSGNLAVSPNGGFNGDLPSGYKFSFLNNQSHAKEHDFAEKLRVGTKIRFTDDKTGPDGEPVIRKITDIKGPWSVVTSQDVSNSRPDECSNFRVTWRITFDKTFGNPVLGHRGYNPLYTFKDVIYYDENGDEVTCPREECTGGATYPWAYDKSQATMYSTESDHENDGNGGFNPTNMEIMEDHVGVGDDEKIVSDSPVIWETEPKRDSDLDLYYEASGAYGVNIQSDSDNPVIRVGSYVRVSQSNPEYATNPTTTINGVAYSWLELNNLDGHVISGGNDSLPDSLSPIITQIHYPGNKISFGNTVDIEGEFSLEIGTILDVIFKGTRVEVVVKDIDYSGADVIVEIEDNFHQNRISLDWYNCFVFGDNIGVESNRIRDDFNAVKLDNGPKASTVAIEGSYKEERRKNGLIYSGLYNSMSGINNLNQFIVGQKITKDLNPTYGSIQKLHARNTDLITLCENKVLRIAANKDALYNADGNPQLISSNNVLGQAVPFVGEYGISKNPESFVSEAYRAYFTDARRGAVLRLSKDGLTAISEHGMRNWFNDYFVTNEKDLGSKYVIGSYDRRKQNYNVTFKNKTVSFNEGSKGWTSFRSMAPEIVNFDDSLVDVSSSNNDFHGVSLNNKYYTFRKGNLWEEYSSTDYSIMYEKQINCSVTTLLNESPEIVKSFNTLNYEGSQSKIDQANYDGEYYNLSNVDGWYVNSIITDEGKSTQQEGAINEFIEKEGKWYNYIKGIHTPGVISSLDPNEFSLQGIGISTDSASNFGVDVYGCMDTGASNYDPNATIDDGSCILCVNGCTDPAADNYNPNATCDDGSCVTAGCMIQGSMNFDPNATTPCTVNGLYPNGCCIQYHYGCLDPSASNYCNTCNVWCDDSSFWSTCNCNFQWVASDDGLLLGDATTNCCVYDVLGCINPVACNYNPGATVDDGSCDYSCIGCSDPLACDYDNSYTGCVVGQGSQNTQFVLGDTSCCNYCTYGCTDINASNYNPAATAACDGGALSNQQGNTSVNCNPPSVNCCCDNTLLAGWSCMAGGTISQAGCCTIDNNTPQYATLQDCLDDSCPSCPTYGCTDPLATNYDPTATVDDGTCVYPTGCIDPTAANYNPNPGVVSDGTCCYGGCSAAGNTLGTQPDINGYCNNMGCTGPPNYTNCTNVGICDPVGGVYTGCDQCQEMVATVMTNTGYFYINHDRDLCHDCGAANNNSDCYDCVDQLGGSDTTCCLASVWGCMDINAQNYFAGATIDDGSCTYANSGCFSTDACNYCANSAVSPANPNASSSLCQYSSPSSCEYSSCEGCVDPTGGFFPGLLQDGVTYVCKGSDNGNHVTAPLWQETDPASIYYQQWFCSHDGTLNPLQANNAVNIAGWKAENYCPECDLPQWWNMQNHNPNNTPLGTHCVYQGSACTDGGNYSPFSQPGASYINTAAVASGLGLHAPSNTPPYQWGSLVPGTPAFNYNPLAGSDDGSCYPVIRGCMDSTAANYMEPCTSGNSGWGSWNGAPTGNPFEDVNTHNQGCCVFAQGGCPDDTASRFAHPIPLGSTTFDFDDHSEGLAYFHKVEWMTNSVSRNMGWWNSYQQSSKGAWNYDAQADPQLWNGDVWEADVPIASGIDNSNMPNNMAVYSVIDPSCASDPTACAGSGNEDGCCYMAGCIHPQALNYDYNGYGGTARQKVKRTIGSDNIGMQWSTNVMVHVALGSYHSSLNLNQYHRTCADCAGNPARDYFVDPISGGQTVKGPGSYLSLDKVDQYADNSCCCFTGGCMDPTACNYYLSQTTNAFFPFGSYQPSVCMDDGSCVYPNPHPHGCSPIPEQ